MTVRTRFAPSPTGYEGAKLDNNRMEAQLKLIVRGRKNFSFYKT